MIDVKCVLTLDERDIPLICTVPFLRTILVLSLRIWQLIRLIHQRLLLVKDLVHIPKVRQRRNCVLS